MSEILATYSFLPWLREGIANNIQNADNDPAVKLRAQIRVELSVSGEKIDGNDFSETVRQQINLFGPGDIIGIDSRAIIKVEPKNHVTNFESNYLPYIEFYHEDFPWRYTPAKVNDDRLRPWITLVVLKEDEFIENRSAKGKPLPSFRLITREDAIDLFPASSQLWAWAHVHVNHDLSDGASGPVFDPDAVTAAMEQVLNRDPDRAYSRCISPRKLEPNTTYHAFLIPSFESGRLAGLGESIPSNLVATTGAWDNRQRIFPFYYRWRFSTGNVGDFEYLVRLLQPRAADKRVGTRDMDVLHPGSNLPPISEPAELMGVLKLGGALKVPYATLDEESRAEVDKYEQWDEPFPHPFETAMAQRVNLFDDYTDPIKSVSEVNNDAAIFIDPGIPDPDPVITSPIYGTWQSLTKRILKEKDSSPFPAAQQENWVHELNLDPRYRVAAGFGTRVIQKGQEEYMHAAWEQVGDIVQANSKIRFAELATEVSFFFYTKHLLTQDTARKIVFTSSLHKKIVNNRTTLYKQVKDSIVPEAITTGLFRNIVRERGPLIKKISAQPGYSRGQLLRKVNDGEVSGTPLKIVPPKALKISDVVDALKPPVNTIFPTKPAPLLLLLITSIIIITALFLFLNVGAGIAGLLIVAVIAGIYYYQSNKSKKAIRLAESIKEENQTPGSVDDLPKSSNFRITNLTEAFSPVHGDTDSPEASRFKTALKDAYSLSAVQTTPPDRVSLALDAMANRIVTHVNPETTIRTKLVNQIKVPDRLKDGMTEPAETISEVMAYPELDIAMYKPLSDLSSELFLPNINLIEQNSITLLETNTKFIEAYMVGLNHEMARELLWREYPTDQRGSYFRQFWDISNFLPASGDIDERLREKLMDIFPIDKWPKIPGAENPEEHLLGKHNPRAQSEANLVLVIRGELLKRYPTAVIYAHRATWGENANGQQDIRVDRKFIELSDAEKNDPGGHRDKVKTPLFEAKVDPDIYFFGFDLTPDQARGTADPTSTADDPGWFFVIKERPGEPRFGLDKTPAPAITNWNNLSWPDTQTEDGETILIDRSITIVDDGGTTEEENKNNPEDRQARWKPNTNAAELAYILYQVPVLVGIHASRMLPAETN